MTESQAAEMLEHSAAVLTWLETLAFSVRVGLVGIGVLIGFKAMQFMRDAAGMPHFWGPRS